MVWSGSPTIVLDFVAFVLKAPYGLPVQQKRALLQWLYNGKVYYTGIYMHLNESEVHMFVSLCN